MIEGEDIRRLTVRTSDAILQVVRSMDRNHAGYALVTDEDGRLAGVVVDSDIRRALINGVDLHQCVETVMTRDFISVRADADESDIVNMLQRTNFAKRAPRVIPALDDQRRPAKLYVLSELVNQLGVATQARSSAATPANILVIGGAGYIGSVLVRHLMELGHQITVLDRLLYGDASIRDLMGASRFEFICGDTRHIDDMVPVIRRADAVVHLAELVGDPLCASDPRTTLEINYLATSSVAQICSYLQINRLIYVSSCSVYGASADPEMVLDEDSELAPVSLYAKTKINSERAIMGMSRGNFSPCIFRLATVFGLSPRPRFDLVVNMLAAKGVADGQIDIFGGTQWRPHVHVTDVVRAIEAALRAPLGSVGNQVFNIVGANHTIGDVGRMVKECIPEVEITTYKESKDIRNYRVSGAKAEKTLGFKAEWSVADGIGEVAEAVRAGVVGDYRDPSYRNSSVCQDEEYADNGR